VTVEASVCSYCGSTHLAVGMFGLPTCSECGTVQEEIIAPKPSFTGTLYSQVFKSEAVEGVNNSLREECLKVYNYLVSKGFRDPAYCVVPLTFILCRKPAEVASMLGMPESLAIYAVTSFLDGVPLDMSYGPKAFMPLRRIELPTQLNYVKLKLQRGEGGTMFVEFNGRIPLKPLYCGRVALKKRALRPTIEELLAVRTRNGTVLCADVECIPKELPIKKRFFGLLRGDLKD